MVKKGPKGIKKSCVESDDLWIALDGSYDESY